MVPQTKVFVGGLPQGSKPEELRKLFEKFGEVTECDIMNRCGFVHMLSEEMASAAILALHNTTFNGDVITVERGRIKERGPRGPGMRNGMDGAPRRPGGGGPMRGPPMGGRDPAPYMRDREPAPYMRDSRPPMRGGDMRGPPMGGGMGMRNGMGGGGGGVPYERGLDRPMGGSAVGYPEDRFGSYGGEDRRGFALMDGRGARGDSYGSAGGMYADERRGYGGGGMEELAPMYPDERRAPLYPDERDMLERRSGMRPPMAMVPSYDRGAPQRPAPMGNGDMFSRRSPPPMRAGGGSGYGERDPYAQQFPPMGRVGGGAGPRGRDMGMGPRRY